MAWPPFSVITWLHVPLQPGPEEDQHIDPPLHLALQAPRFEAMAL